MDDTGALLITVTGLDRPGLTASLCETLDAQGARLLDLEQVVIRDRLLLGLLASPGVEVEALRAAVIATGEELGVEVTVESMAARRPRTIGPRHYVTVLGQPLRPSALAALTGRIAEVGGNIDRITRLSRYPVLSFEMLVSRAEADALRICLSDEASRQGVDVAVQPADLYRRAKRLVCFDVDSTLVQGEAIEQLAARAGCSEQVAAATSAAMAGEADFAGSLHDRVALLEGLPASALDEVRAELQLMPGARTLTRTLKRLGFQLAVVSGGFTAITDELCERLDIDFAAANTLEVVDGHLTGRVVGPVVDREAKASFLERFAADAGVPLSQTVAVGDGANDADMLRRAGLGIAFNAKAPAREAADTAISVPYLDALLFLLGITREEIDEADAAQDATDAASSRGR